MTYWLIDIHPSNTKNKWLNTHVCIKTSMQKYQCHINQRPKWRRIIVINQEQFLFQMKYIRTMITRWINYIRKQAELWNQNTQKQQGKKPPRETFGSSFFKSLSFSFLLFFLTYLSALLYFLITKLPTPLKMAAPSLVTLASREDPLCLPFSLFFLLSFANLSFFTLSCLLLFFSQFANPLFALGFGYL